MAHVSITEAAKLAGKSRTTIYEYIKQHKLAFDVDREGRKVIDPSELIRVFGEIKLPGASSDERSGERTGGHGRTHESVQLLQQRVEDLERENTELRKDKEDMRQERKELLDIIKQQTLLLPAPAGNPVEQAPAKQEQQAKAEAKDKKPGLLARLFGRAA